MSHRGLFKQNDLTRALRAATKAGVAVRVEIEPGRMTVIPVTEHTGPARNVDEMFS
jgi:hypothetical protein